MRKMMKKFLSIVLCLSMVLSCMPVTTFAADTDCTHHPEHTTDCGYVAPVCDCGTDDKSIHATICAVYVAPENPVCYCVEKCTESNIWCDVCGIDYTKCGGTDTAAGYAEGDVASVTVGENATGYTSISNAISAAQENEGSTLKLLDDINAGATATDISSGTFTIDLNGKTWQSSNTVINIKNAANITITDSTSTGEGTLRGTGASTIWLWDTAVLNLAGGTLSGADSVVYMSPNGYSTQAQFVMYGGTLKTDAYNAIVAYGKSVTISGGTLEGEIQYVTGEIDLSGHSNPTGILIYTSASLPENPVINLPKGYVLLDRYSNNVVTTLTTGTDYIVGKCDHGGENATYDNGICTICGLVCEHNNFEGDKCTICGYQCTHTGGTATCVAKAVCEACGESYGELGGHTPDESGYTFNAATHSYTCAGCGITVTEAHSFTENICTVCDGIGGYCGDPSVNDGKDVLWTLVDGKLTISGTGAMSGSWEGNKDVSWYAYRSTIKTVVIESGVTSIAAYAFAGCYNLTDVTIPDSVTAIGASAFMSDSALEKLTIPDSVTTVTGSATFDDCTSLTRISLGSGVATFKPYFLGCIALEEIAVSESNPNFKSVDGVLFSKDGKTLVQYPEGKSDSYEIPAGVTTIGEGAFYGRTMTAVSIGNGVNIDINAFTESDLTTVTIGDGVTIDINAFYKSDLTNLTIGDNATIGEKAFGWSEDPTTVTIGDGATIQNKAFYFSEMTALTIGDNVTISESAFGYCDRLTSVTMGDDVTVGELGFAYCTKSATLTVGDDVILNKYAFYDTAVTSVTVGSDAAIGESAFANCDALTTVTMGSGVTIGEYAFNNCGALTTVNAACDWDGSQYTFDTGVTVNVTEHNIVDNVCTNCGFTCYNLWVGGVQVNSDNAANVLGDGKVSYDADNQTLTLSGADISTADLDEAVPPLKVTGGDITLVLVGENKLTGSANCPGILIESGASLTVSQASTGSLDVQGQKLGYLSQEKIYVNSSIAGYGDFTVSGGTVTGAVYMGGTITITGGTVNADFLAAKNVIISGGTVTATGQANVDYSDQKAPTGTYGIFANNDIQISGGSVTVSGGYANITESYDSMKISQASATAAMYAGNAVTVSGGTVTATGGEWNGYYPDDLGFMQIGGGYTEDGDDFGSYDTVIDKYGKALKASSFTISDNASFTCGDGTPGNHSHSYADATCASGAVCAFCGDTYGTADPSNHIWSYSVANNVINASCTNCEVSGTATITAKNATYNGEAVEATVETTGVLANTTIAVTYAVKDGTTLESAPVNAGTYTASITLGEGENAATASVEFTVSPKDISKVASVEFSLEQTSFTYSGEAPTLNVTGVDSSVGSYTMQEGTDYTVGTVQADAGSHKLTVTGIGNYTGTVELDYTITAKSITPTVEGVDASYTYTGQAIQPTVTVKDGDTVLVKDTDYTVSYGENMTVANGGSVTVTLKGNYSGERTVNFAITKAPLTVTADDKTMTTGHNLPTFTYTITGFVNGETEDVLTTKPTANTTANGQTAGNYEITVSGAEAANYSFSYVKGTLSVVDHQHAWAYTADGNTITATCDNADTCPNATQSITISATGKTYDGTAVTATLTGSIDGVTTPEISYSGNTNAGTHTASITIEGKTASVKFTIDRATPTVAWDNTSVSVNYTGSTASITTPTVTLVNGETFSGIISYSYTGISSGNGLPINAGTYEITASIAAQGNYTATTSTNKLTLTIKKQEITVPTMSWTLPQNTVYNGTEYSTTLNGTLPAGVEATLSGDKATNAGSYTAKAVFSLAEGYSADNYEIVNGADLTADWTIAKKNIANAEIILGTALTYNGKQQTQTVASVKIDGLTVTYTVSGNTGTESGFYTMTVTATGNFAGTVTQTWQIHKKAVTVTAEDQTITYGSTISDTEFTSDGLVDGHSVTATLTPSTANVTVDGIITASAAVITADGTDVTNNYNVSYTSGKLVIEPDTSKIDALTTENVTSANKEDIKAVQAMMASAETDDVDDATVEQWAAITAKCDALIDVIEAVEAENTRIADAAADYDLNTVKSSDEAAVTALIADIDEQLATNNLTDEERSELEGLKTKCNNLIAKIDGTETLIGQLDKTVDDLDAETVKSTDTAALEQVIADAQTLIDSGNVTEAEKEALREIQEDAKALIKVIDDTAAEEKALSDQTATFDEDTVKSTDKTVLEQLAQDIEDLLDTQNLTEDERTSLEAVLKQVEGMIDTIKETAEDSKAATDSIEALDPTTVTSDDKDELEQAIATTDELLQTDHLTEEERSALEDAKADAEALIERIEAAQDATNTENTDKVEDVTAENVKPEDKEALEDAKADLEKALEDNAGNYTEEEKQAIQDEIQRIEDAMVALENVEDVTETITQLPETVEPDDEETAEEILDAKKAYDELTDHEKSLVDETTKKKLDGLVAALTAYDIIKGDGGKWTKGSSYGLSFTANGPFNKFIGIEVDGREVAATHYTAKAGSTVITLKVSYLEELSVGTHTLTVLYTDGETSGIFAIRAASNVPTTGDASNFVLWTSLLCVSTLSLIALVGNHKKKKHH